MQPYIIREGLQIKQNVQKRCKQKGNEMKSLMGAISLWEV